MSDVFQDHFDELSKAIANPAPLAKAFATKEILSPEEKQDILDLTSTRTAQNRTDDMLNTVSRRIHDRQSLGVVLTVLYRDVATKHIAVKMSEEAGLGDPGQWQSQPNPPNPHSLDETDNAADSYGFRRGDAR